MTIEELIQPREPYPNLVAERYLRRCAFAHGEYMKLVNKKRADFGKDWEDLTHDKT